MTGLLTRQVGLELKSFWRSPQAASFTVVLPVGLLVVLGFTSFRGAIPGSAGVRAIELVVPGIIAFGVISAAYMNLAFNLAVQRDEGILKRVRATPLPRWVFVFGHIGSSVVLTAVIVAVMLPLGTLLYGVGVPADRLGGLVLAVTVGTACFCALGLAVSVLIPNSDAASPITNATFYPLAIVSGLFYPTQLLHLPDWLEKVVAFFPIQRLAHAFQQAYTGRAATDVIADLAVMAAWCVAAVFVSVRWFRWTNDR
jgi:ABC-2 type transport system permease protein